jgi:hypothetical protein
MEQHWLVRPATIRKLSIIMMIILAVNVLVQVFVPVHGHFGIDERFAFGAWFGLAACMAMIIFAKLLGVLLKRPDDYYDR